MRKWKSSLVKKLWLTITGTILITILYSYFLSYLFYEKLYVNNVKQSLLAEGNRLAAEYKGGPLTDELKNRIDWYNSKSETEVLVVSNPRELSACLPFDIDYKTLISEEERNLLLKGKPVQKMGYEARFDRQIMAVIIPLLDHERLEGIIYLYLPLAKISELTDDFAYLWIIGGVLFVIISIFIGTKWIGRLTKPLEEMKIAAMRVSLGDYSQRVQIHSHDEIGELGNAFNQMSAAIQKEDERKKDFLANVSHELRTPISYVKGYSDAIITGIIKEEEQMKYLQLIHREAGRMERLVGDLLDLAKLDTDEYQLIKMPLPLAQLIEDSLQKYIPTFKEKGLNLTLDLDEEIIINGDEGRIEQILQNIIDNSIRYTKNGGIVVKLQKHPKGCCLQVEDTGMGIPADDVKKLTQRFYRVNKARTRSDGGTGLGLAIVEKLIHLHNGEITIQSTVGKGTTVSIVFPTIADE